MDRLSVTICCLGLLYCKTERGVGQDGTGVNKLNLIDLSLLPLTPIMGSGTAPLQPQEVADAARRIAFLAMTDPDSRPRTETNHNHLKTAQSKSLRVYDAVGPEVVPILNLLKKFAHYQKKNTFYPVHIGRT